MLAADFDTVIGDFGGGNRDEFAFVRDIQDVKTERVGGSLDRRVDWDIRVFNPDVERGLLSDFV
jgi:hypothetical protein